MILQCLVSGIGGDHSIICQWSTVTEHVPSFYARREMTLNLAWCPRFYPQIFIDLTVVFSFDAPDDALAAWWTWLTGMCVRVCVADATIRFLCVPVLVFSSLTIRVRRWLKAGLVCRISCKVKLWRCWYRSLAQAFQRDMSNCACLR